MSTAATALVAPVDLPSGLLGAVFALAFLRQRALASASRSASRRWTRVGS